MGRPKAKKEEDVSELSRRAGVTLTVGIGILAVIFLLPILVVLQNSFKSKLYISNVRIRVFLIHHGVFGSPHHPVYFDDRLVYREG